MVSWCSEKYEVDPHVVTCGELSAVMAKQGDLRVGQGTQLSLTGQRLCGYKVS